MKPSKKAGLVGMFIGAALLAVSALLFFVPFFFTQRALITSPDFIVRHKTLSSGLSSLLIGAPIGVVCGGLGALVLFLSLFVYLDSRRAR